MTLEDLNNPEVMFPSMKKPEHVCGATDFAYAPGAVCPACDLAENNYKLTRASRVDEDGHTLPEIELDSTFAKALMKEESDIQRYNDYVTMCGNADVVPMDYETWCDWDRNVYQKHVMKASSVLSPATFQEVDKAVPTVSDLQAEVETKTALISLLREESYNLRSEKDKLIFELEEEILNLKSDRDGLREANSKLALRCQELVDTYEDQKSELWKKIEGLRDRVHELTSESELVRVTKERDDLAKDLALTVNHKNAAERFTQTLRDELGSLKREALFNKQSYTDEDYESLLAIRDELVLENEALIKELSANGQRTTPSNQPLYPHYFREVTNVSHVDVYWLLRAWDVSDPCVQHAVKKLIAAGRRGAKDKVKDLNEAKDSIVRALELEQTT